MRKLGITLLIVLFILSGTSCSDEASRVAVQAYYEEPVSMSEEDTIVLDGLHTGEFLEIRIDGEIIDFQYLSILFDENSSEFITGNTIHEFDRITDQVIVIKTYLPEGIPSEAIRWKSVSGKEYEFLVGEFDLSDDGARLIEYIME